MGQAWEVVIDLWETGNWWARAAIISVLGPPLVALLFALKGLNAVAMAVALIPLLALVFVPLALIDPMVIGVVAGALGLHPTAASIRQWLARWIPLYIGSVLTYGVYLFFVPIGNNPVLVLPLVGAVGAAALFAVGGARRVARFFAAIATGITVAFFFSGRSKEETAEAAVQAGVGVSQTAQAEVREIVRIQLLGENKPSEKFLGPRIVPAGWDYFFEGPPEAKVHFDDGTVGPITKWYGLKGGVRRFSGPEGQEVVVRTYPPSEK